MDVQQNVLMCNIFFALFAFETGCRIKGEGNDAG
jgi:hypothetical protein